jgi:hypothetical protein
MAELNRRIGAAVAATIVAAGLTASGFCDRSVTAAYAHGTPRSTNSKPTAIIYAPDANHPSENKVRFFGTRFSNSRTSTSVAAWWSRTLYLVTRRGGRSRA